MSPVEMITEPLGQSPSDLDDVHETGVPNLERQKVEALRRFSSPKKRAYNPREGSSGPP